MIISGLIAQCRREFGDIPKSMQVRQLGDGVSTLFNVGSFPVVEGSYATYVNSALKSDTSDYTLDLDSGDLQFTVAPGSGIEARTEFKYALWRDKDWVDAINNGVEDLNARGFFRQIVRNTSLFAISANVRTYSGPTNAVDVYEILTYDTRTTSGAYRSLWGNWSYQQDANKIVIGSNPTVAQPAVISYLRNLQTYTATSATLDVINDWVILVKKKAGENFYRYVAGKIAKQGNANIDEGHFSFTNLRTMANDLNADHELLARKKKPTRPAKDMQYHLAGGGVA